VLNEGLTTITKWSFRGCTSLSSINFPSTLKEIGNANFKNSLENVDIVLPKSITSFGNAFSGSKISSIAFEEGSVITQFASNAFSDCTNLKSVTIPESVTTIGGTGYYAFRNCTSISSIVIPATVTTIGPNTFENWTSSQTINFCVASKLSGYNSNYLKSCNATINWGYTGE